MARRRKSKSNSTRADRAAHARLRRLAAEQGVKPLTDLDEVGAPLAVEPDPDAMIAFIQAERAARRAMVSNGRKRKSA